jgi:hypothetical protein
MHTTAGNVIRKMRALAALTMITILGTVGFSTPAHAGTWKFYGSYAHYDFCYNAGTAGVANHTWLAYQCVTVIPDISAPGRIDLYVELP